MSPSAERWVRLAGALTWEFGAPVGLLDADRGLWRARLGSRPEAFPEAEAASAAAAASIPLRRGRASLWRPSPGPGDGPVWLILPADRPRGPAVTAWVGFSGGANPAPGGPGDWGPRCPDRALLAWGQAVAERLHGEAPERAPGAGGSALSLAALTARPERPLPDRLTRKLRVSDPPERFQALAARALRDALDVEAVAWVPLARHEPVVVAGGVEGLDAEDFRLLLPGPSDEPIRIDNRPISPPSPALRRVAAATTDPEAPVGWLLAVNPRDDRPFAPEEVETLRPVATLIGTQRSNARHYAELKDLLFGVIRALTSAIDAKDPYTLGHSERVGRIAVQLGEAMGLSANRRGDLYLMGLLHDVGKIGIEDSVLKKPGALTPEEFRQIQEHVRIGVHILKDLKKLGHLLPGVAHHHENFDGTGYPDGLAGEAIPIDARILAVADAFDAMSSTRPYRRRLSPARIDEIFREGAGIQWDPEVVEALFACRAEVERIRQKGLGESVQHAVDDALNRS